MTAERVGFAIGAAVVWLAIVATIVVFFRQPRTDRRPPDNKPAGRYDLPRKDTP